MSRPVLTFAVVGLGVVLAVMSLRVAPAHSAQAGLVAYGRAIAARYCAECHSLERGKPSPLADAPPIPELYRRFPVERMAEALEFGMFADHPRMPNFDLDADERQALTAYLSSFAPKGRRTKPMRPRSYGAGLAPSAGLST
jgi:cytochrome c